MGSCSSTQQNKFKEEAQKAGEKAKAEKEKRDKKECEFTDEETFKFDISTEWKEDQTFEEKVKYLLLVNPSKATKMPGIPNLPHNFKVVEADETCETVTEIDNEFLAYAGIEKALLDNLKNVKTIGNECLTRCICEDPECKFHEHKELKEGEPEELEPGLRVLKCTWENLEEVGDGFSASNTLSEVPEGMDKWGKITKLGNYFLGQALIPKFDFVKSWGSLQSVGTDFLNGSMKPKDDKYTLSSDAFTSWTKVKSVGERFGFGSEAFPETLDLSGWSSLEGSPAEIVWIADLNGTKKIQVGDALASKHNIEKEFDAFDPPEEEEEEGEEEDQ